MGLSSPSCILSSVLNRGIVKASERALELQLGVTVWGPNGEPIFSLLGVRHSSTFVF